MTNISYDHQYKETIGKGKLTIREGTIVCSSNYESYRIAVKRIKKIFLWKYMFWGRLETTLMMVVTGDAEPRMDYDRKKYIPVDFEGFADVLDLLDRQLHFDTKLLDRHLGKSKPCQILLWEKKRKSSVDILKTFPDDISSGFEIIGPVRKFIPWGTPARDVSRLSQCTRDPQTHQFLFKCPIRIGNLVISDIPFSYDADGIEMVLRVDGAVPAFQFVQDAIMDSAPPHAKPSESTYLVVDHGPIRIRVLYPHGNSFQSSSDFYADENEVDFSIEYTALQE